MQRDPAEREAYLREACHGDAGLQGEVASLLANHHEATDFAPWAAAAAAELIAGPASLEAGHRLGPYQILAPIGKGGMGEVYKARDTRLKRDVAIKICAAQFSERFEREAQVIASLNHPNICQLHDVGPNFLVMELVEGPTLADRISAAPPSRRPVEAGKMPALQTGRPQGAPLQVDESLHIAKQIAEGLEYAHEKGIVHRDLKPANVKVTPEGQVKVLDIGLAKALEGETSEEHVQNSPTVSAAATREGVLLGTAAYMSPEQARGKRVDRRADIWAFGCVLYEMLTGKRAFIGESISDTLAAVIRAEPDWASLRADTPPAIRTLLRRCLQKDQRQRLQAIGDARIVIEETLAGVTETEVAPPAERPRWFSGRAAALVGLALLVGAIVAGLIFWGYREPAALKAVSRLSLLLPAGDSIGPGSLIALSPDGNAVVYSARHGTTTRLYLRSMDRFEATLLPGTEGSAEPFFSPDGQWIGFFAGGKLKKVAVYGGQPVTLCEAPTPFGASWGPDDTIVFTPKYLMSSLMRIPAAGGTPQKLTELNTPAKEVTHKWPEVLPGGKAVVFVIGEPKDIGSYQESKIAVERLDTHQRKILPILGTYPRYAPSGHLLYVREGRIFAVPFDLNRLEVTGPPAPVLDRVALYTGTGSAAYAVSPTSSLAYIPESAVSSERLLAWVDRKNQIQPLAAPTKEYNTLNLSPDGQRVAVAIGPGLNADVWVYDLPRGTLTRLTFDGHSGAPVWSPDGKRIAYRTRRGAEWEIEIRSKAADGSGAEETLLARQDLFQIPGSWSPDGKFLAYTSMSPDTGFDVFVLPLEGERKPRPFVQTKFNECCPAFSPDGHWIAYMSNETGRNEVYVQPFPGPGGKWQVSIDGGGQPVWGRGGRELFYVNANKVMSVGVITQRSFSASTPRFVADVPPSTLLPLFSNAGYASPDGQRFLFVKASEENGPPGEVRIVLNWSEELKRLAPQAKKP